MIDVNSLAVARKFVGTVGVFDSGQFSGVVPENANEVKVHSWCENRYELNGAVLSYVTHEEATTIRSEKCEPAAGKMFGRDYIETTSVVARSHKIYVSVQVAMKYSELPEVDPEYLVVQEHKELIKQLPSAKWQEYRGTKTTDSKTVRYQVGIAPDGEDAEPKYYEHCSASNTKSNVEEWYAPETLILCSSGWVVEPKGGLTLAQEKRKEAFVAYYKQQEAEAAAWKLANAAERAKEDAVRKAKVSKKVDNSEFSKAQRANNPFAALLKK